MNLNKISAFLVSFALVMFMGMSLVNAQDQGENPSNGGDEGESIGSGITVDLDNPFQGNGDVFSVLSSLIDNVLMPIGGVLAVMGFIWAGFQYVTAQGDTKKIDNAHIAFKYTAIGTVILFGSRAIAEIIKNTIHQLQQL